MPPKKQKKQATRIAFIEARWHADIVDQGRNAFVAALCARGMNEDEIDLYDVPGSLEIPLMAKKVALCSTVSCRCRWKPGCRCCPWC